MNTKLRIYAGRALNLFFFALFVYLLCFPVNATEPTLAALSFCANRVVPSLFIYSVLAAVVFSSDFIQRLCSGGSLGGVVTVLAGLVCGFPVGAQNCVRLYQNGVISRKKGEYLYCVCGSPSLSFILAFAGSNVLGSFYFGIRLMMFQLASFGVNAVVMRFLICPDKEEKAYDLPKTFKSISFTSAVGDSALLCVRICGFVAFFFTLGSVISGFLPDGSLMGVAVRGLLEFSGGVMLAGEYSAKTAFPLCGLFIGFGSVSAAAQTVSVVKNVFPLKHFLLSRVINASVVTVLCLLT